MALKLFNTLSRAVEDFVPLDPSQKQVGMYCCGPTIYDFGHIGNFRTFMLADLLRRYLQFRGYDVQHVMNITDVEDKIIARVRAAGTSLPEYTSRYEKAFFEDLSALGCLTPHRTPRATEHIGPIIALIEKLIAQGLAYQAPDQSVYFSIEKYRVSGARYGQLINLNFDQMRVGERVRSDEYAKESVADFALWKARVPEDGKVFWPSPWGEGRPGWHIECSAMSMQLLGASFDLHLGGEDLIFPHHEDEIAQSEGAHLQGPGQRFVKYWVHGAHLLVEGKKMSKSLGNFYTLRDLLAKGFTGREIRYLLLTAHYREQFNFTLEGLQGARSALSRLDNCVLRLKESTGSNKGDPDTAVLQAFTAALDEDLNISAGWAVVFEWVAKLNRGLSANQVSASDADTALATWERLDSVLGLGLGQQQAMRFETAPGAAAAADSAIPAEIAALFEQRQAARKAKDFKRADTLRAELKAKGWVIEDTPNGVRLKRL
jgi:cysteinyl-tRNA synthetase